MDEPLTLILEITRKEYADDPHGLYMLAPEDYHVRDDQKKDISVANFPWDTDVKADFEALHTTSSDRDARQRMVEAQQRMGHRLATFLKGTCWAKMEATIVAAQKKGQYVFLTICSSAAEIYTLPFELLTLEGSDQPLGRLPNLCIRYEWRGTETKAEKPNPRPEGGRILLAHSAAEDIETTAKKHRETISASMTATGWTFDSNQDVVAGVTLASLRKVFENKTKQNSITVLHLLTHGDQDGLVFPEDEKSTAQRINAIAFANLLEEFAGSLRLVVLAACQSGDSQLPNGHLVSVAQALHRAGVEAVVAARFPLTKEGSTSFTKAFYKALLEGPTSVEMAFIAAREVLEYRAVSNLDWACLQLYRRAADGVDARPIPFRPYRGLLPFEEHHRRFFYGRETERALLKARLDEAMNHRRPQFQMVVGASGTGKSSLVMSGVSADVQGAGWNVVKMRPAERQHALDALENALKKARPSGPGRASSLGEAVPSIPFPTRTKTRPAMQLQFDADDAGPNSNAETLGRESRRFTHEARGGRWLLIVDQFEEIFTLVSSAEERRIFVETLLELSRAQEASVVVLCIMRVDYLARIGEIIVKDGMLKYSLDRIAYDPNHTYSLTRMPHDRLRDVVVRPATRVGIRFESGLPEHIISEAGEDAASLPLLAYVLDELWTNRSGQILTLDAYKKLNGFRGALGRAADRVYFHELTPKQQEQAKTFLEAMVSPGEGNRADARARAWTDQLKPKDPERAAAFDTALTKFEHSRLIVTGNDLAAGAWAELAHDALLQQWSTLHEWISQDRESLAEIAKLRISAQKHHEDPHAPEYLLYGKLLTKALTLREEKRELLGRDCLEFIAASERAEERRQAALKEEAERAASAKEAAAAREREEMRNHMVLAVGVIMLLSASTFIAVLFYGRSEKAAEDLKVTNVELQKEQERTKESSKHARMAALLATSGRLVDTDATRAIVFLREIEKPDDLDGFEETALKALDKPIAEKLFEGQHGAIRALRFTRDNRDLVVAGSDGTIFTLPMGGGEERILTQHENGAQIFSLTLTSDGRGVISASDDKEVHIASLDGTTPVVTIAHTHPVLAVATNPKDGTIATASDSAPRIFKASSASKLPHVLGTPNDSTRQITALAYRSDGLELASGASDGRIGLHSLRGSNEAEFIDVVSGHVISLEYDATGSQLLVVADADPVDRIDAGLVRLVRLDAQSPAPVLAGGVTAHWAAFSPTGKHIALRGIDGAVRVLAASGEGEVLTIWRDNPILRADWSADGHIILGVDQNDILHVRRLGAATDEAIIPAACSVSRMAMNDDGSAIAAGCRTGEVRVFRVHTRFLRKENLSDALVERRVLSAAWTKTGEGLAVLIQEDGRRVLRIRRSSPDEFVNAGEFPDGRNLVVSPDGAHVAVLRDDHGVFLLPTRAVMAPRRAHEKTPSVAPIEIKDTSIHAVAFNPTGTHLATASENGYACVYEVGLSEPSRCFLHKGSVRTIAWLANGQEIVTSSSDGWVRVYAIDQDKPKTELRHDEPVALAVPSLDGKRIVTLTDRKTARVWVAETRTYQSSHSVHEGKFVSAAVSARNILLVYNTGASLFNLELNDEKPLMLAGGTVEAAEFSPDGDFVATLSRDGATRVFRTEGNHRGRLTATLHEPSTPIRWLAWTANPELSLLTASTNGIVQSRPMKIEDISRKLWAASAYCPSAQLRKRMLANDSDTADESVKQCVKNLESRQSDPSL